MVEDYPTYASFGNSEVGHGDRALLRAAGWGLTLAKFYQKYCGYGRIQWIGLRENLQESPYLVGKTMVSSRFSVKPSHWGIVYLLNSLGSSQLPMSSTRSKSLAALDVQMDTWEMAPRKTMGFVRNFPDFLGTAPRPRSVDVRIEIVKSTLAFLLVLAAAPWLNAISPVWWMSDVWFSEHQPFNRNL